MKILLPCIIFSIVCLASASKTWADWCLQGSEVSPEADRIIKRESVNNPEASRRWVYQEFGIGEEQTAWLVGYGEDVDRNSTLLITAAYFRPGGREEFVKVLGRSGLWEIHVAYATGSPRWWDIRDYDLGLNPIGAEQRGPCSTAIGATIVKQVRDRGLIWKKGAGGRRGYEMILWATQNADHYDYVVKYSFQDVGAIRFEFGATSSNRFSDEFVKHLHTGLWRINLDVDGADDDTVFVSNYELSTNNRLAKFNLSVFNDGKEGGMNLNPALFNSIVVTDANKKNRPAATETTGYQIVRTSSGSVRHRSNVRGEAVLEKDVWVTRQFGGDIQFVPQAAENEESIEGEDVVIWMATPILHWPRDEDGLCQPEGIQTDRGCYILSGSWEGVALVMTAGLMLVPRNLFAGTPFYASTPSSP